ncbi:MAG: carboxy terminal-processing peptidase [Bacteriovoracia bacterium]
MKNSLPLAKRLLNLLPGLPAIVISLALLGPASVPSWGALTSNSSLRCENIPQLFKAFLVHHVKSKDMNEDLKKRTVDLYIKSMDPSKTRILESDLPKMRADLLALFDSMNRANCEVLSTLHHDMVKRAKEIEDFVRKTVTDKNYKLDETVELVIDPDKRGYPKSAKERSDLLLKLIHFQVTNYLSAGTKLEDAKTQLVHRYELFTKRTEEEDLGDLFSLLVDAFANAMDPHSSYLSPEVLEDFQISMGLSLEGIGVSLTSRDGYTVVEEIIPGGAAHKLQILKPKDKIMSVKQETGEPVNIMDMALRDVVRMIRGKKGTKVTLSILRQGEKTERLSATITRDKIDLTEQAANVKFEKKAINGKNYKFALVDLPSFYGDKDPAKRSSYKDMLEIMRKIKKEKVDGVVLDLSRNGGGLLTDAVKISGLFVKTGGVVATKDSQNHVEVLTDTDEDINYAGPLVVLESRLSASASEIVAGALKDYRRAIIVGDDHTFGKGTVQSVLPLPNGFGALKVTSGLFFRPQGMSTQHEGVRADIVIPSLYNMDDLGEKSLDYSLLPEKIPPFVNLSDAARIGSDKWTPLTDTVIADLAKRSEARVSQSKEFKELKEKLEKAKRNKGTVKLSDVRKESEEEEKKTVWKTGPKKNKEKTLREQAEEARAPQIKEAMNILADYVGAHLTAPKLVQGEGAAAGRKN